MALIKCPECGKDVSDTIESCIHCGFVLKKAEERTEQQEQSQIELQKDCNEIVDSTDNSSVTTVPKSSIFKFIIWSIVAIVIVFFFIVAIAPKPVTGSNINSTSTTTTVPAVEMNAVKILYDFFENELVAKEKYIGHRYRCTATSVSTIKEDYISIEQELDTGSFYIELYYEDSQIDYVKTLENGDTVTFEGKLTDVFPPNGVIQSGLTFENVIFIEETE